ncbi:Hsp20/alpha crystallin family protein [Salinisphaera sp. Q1T1-3]|uniref:Hsp20/alpha crystallin family protein n=1 Tax=Salinisphaera sp. Q1T1-3 TaxID=2321229 RepID=UPI000E72EB4F|nr:Hsp20/alpha crystallin family protein [Salinisphaera sp. Q1T1-3]RJS92938.1 Hsp20/alpha crystallin family protein [Salinisphaera sp. Q1T1-3]
MAKKTGNIPKASQNPFRGFLDVMSEMNRAQEAWFNRSTTGVGGESRSHAEAYVPPADIFAIGNDLFVRCELPGVRSEDVSVTVVSNVLTISGRRHSELDDTEVLYYTRERVYGEFRRAMILPDGVDDSAITAAVRNGLMEIRVRGGAAAQPRTISVQDENDDAD